MEIAAVALSNPEQPHELALRTVQAAARRLNMTDEEAGAVCAALRAAAPFGMEMSRTAQGAIDRRLAYLESQLHPGGAYAVGTDEGRHYTAVVPLPDAQHPPTIGTTDPATCTHATMHPGISGGTVFMYCRECDTAWEEPFSQTQDAEPLARHVESVDPLAPWCVITWEPRDVPGHFGYLLYPGPYETFSREEGPSLGPERQAGTYESQVLYPSQQMAAGAAVFWLWKSNPHAMVTELYDQLNGPDDLIMRVPRPLSLMGPGGAVVADVGAVGDQTTGGKSN
jgi:hypothetical protein